MILVGRDLSPFTRRVLVSMTQRHNLRLADVCLSLSQRPLFAPLDVSIAAGEIVTVMGESGSGKSSLLNFICGTLPKDMAAVGKVLLDEQDISHLTPEQRQVGILFQDDLLFPHLSVAENLAFGLPRSIRGQQRWEQVSAALNRAGLAGLGRRDPATLSGGQRARAALMVRTASLPLICRVKEPSYFKVLASVVPSATSSASRRPTGSG